MSRRAYMRRNSRSESKAFSIRILFILSIAFANGPFHMQGLYDFDNDGKPESIVQNVPSGASLSLLEFTPRGESNPIWSWNSTHSGMIMDIDVSDINEDGFKDIIAVSHRQPGEVIQPWLFLFLGSESGLSDKPLELFPSDLKLSSVRPTTVNVIDNKNLFAVSMGSPVRKTVVFTLNYSNEKVSIDQISYIGTDLIKNGYGKVASSVLRHNEKPFILQLSSENNRLKVGVFETETFMEVSSDILVSESRGRIINEGILFSESEGVLLPFHSGDVEAVFFDGKNVSIKPSSFSKKNLFTESNPKKRYLSWVREKLFPRAGPTLTDYLKKAHEESSPKQATLLVNQIPVVSMEMTSEQIIVEAGGENVTIVEPDLIPENPILPPDEKDKIPNADDGVSVFTESVKDTIMRQSNPDTTIAVELETEFVPIDLYFAQVMTPIGKTPQRFVFDGESPFGVGVNKMPMVGDPTHIQHSISANLAHLNRGSVYDFAYSIRNARLDSLTTISMVHDMQTNVVFLSISPLKDSLSQSYQPNSFDPTLFEFPDYFFEGFPASLGMDFTDRLIRFSFDEDSTAKPETHGIYLSATSPSIPAQSLAVFLDKGELQAIRGEVKVRENGSKKITTEFDLFGHVDPAVMFSRLIEEVFPDSLKIKLLQGGTFEEPLWRSSGQFPEILMKKRLPDELKEQSNPKIPIKATQSHVPTIDSLSIEGESEPEKADMENGVEEEIEPKLPTEQSPVDKIEDEPKNQIKTIEPDSSQSEKTDSETKLN